MMTEAPENAKSIKCVWMSSILSDYDQATWHWNHTPVALIQRELSTHIQSLLKYPTKSRQYPVIQHLLGVEQ